MMRQILLRVIFANKVSSSVKLLKVMELVNVTAPYSMDLAWRLTKEACKVWLERFKISESSFVKLRNAKWFCFSRYGLLGASGCGKTTLLSCIVGRRSLNSGEISVFGDEPGSPGCGIPGPRVGYMPQELALCGDFTIKETLQYFGHFFNLSPTFVKSQIKTLSTLLNLPDKNRYVKTLSGGQQRRVSFTVALFHEPDLLILDEPTVGVDPLLRQR